MTIANRKRWIVIAAALAVLVLWFVPLEYRSLFHPDEGRYAEIPREMLESGDWVTPRLNGIRYFEKPPFQYWITAAAYAAFGIHHWSSRLWTGLSGLLTVGLVAWMGSLLYGRRVGLLAAAVLGSSFLFLLGSHINTLDMGLTFWLTLGLASFLAALRQPDRSLWSDMAWVALAFGVLSKGIVALVLPAATAIAYCGLERDTSILRSLRPLRGAIIVLALAGPWFIAVSIANPEFAQFFFVHEHVERFLTKTHGREQAWWFFGPVLALGLFPWLGLLPSAALSAWNVERWLRRETRILLLWAVIPVLFFSLSRSKLPFYICPVLPAVSLLIARELAAIRESQLWLLRVPAFAAGLVSLAFAAIAAVAWRDIETRALIVDWADSVALFGALACAAALALKPVFMRHGLVPATCMLAAAAFVGTIAMLVDAEDLASRYSARELAVSIAANVPSEAVVFSVGDYQQTLPFYLGRSVRLVGFRGELDFGLGLGDAEWIADNHALAAAWPKGCSIAVIGRDGIAQFPAAGGTVEIVYSDARVVAAKRCGPAGRPD